MKVLYISGSLGLGHVTRDLAIANELRKLLPDIEIEWLAAHPATTVLLNEGENLVPQYEQYADENLSAEKASDGSSLNLFKYLMRSRKEWKQNIEIFLSLIKSKKYDMVIGDETYEINLAMREHPELKQFPFVMIFDFVGLDSMTKNPLEKLGVYYWNGVWSHDYRLKKKPPYDLALFVGVEQDVPDKPFGFMLPNRREFAKSMYKFIGYVFPFEVSEYRNKNDIKKKLGYDVRPLVICSIGGTSIGKDLLELCSKAYSVARNKLPDLHMKIVTGPRLKGDRLKIANDIEVEGYVPRLYEHFAAADLAIVQGGATSTLELTVLRTPFIYFPIEGHCEQFHVSEILSQHGAGTKLTLSKANPDLLGQKIIELLGKPVSYPEIPSDGAKKAAQLILNLLNKS